MQWAKRSLTAAAEVEKITLTMPNKHRILADLKPFGLDNANEIFVATDEPYWIDHRHTVASSVAGLVRGGFHHRQASERPRQHDHPPANVRGRAEFVRAGG